MKKSLVSLALGSVLGLSGPGAALAAPVFIDNGVDYGPNLSTKTDDFDQLGYTGTLATSIYLGDPTKIGTTIIDTNMASVMTAYGFTPGPHTSLASTPIFIANIPGNVPMFPGTGTAGFGTLNVDNLNYPGDDNGFTTGTGSNPYGAGRWGLTYSYQIKGVITNSGISFSSGQIDVIYQDGVAAIKVAQLDLTSSDMNLANLDLFGKASYNFAGAANPFVQNFFHDGVTGKTFYENWLADPESVSWHLDTNVNPPVPLPKDLWYGTVDMDPNTAGVQAALFRQATTDGSLDFAVPEPGSLALLGLGLAGLGLIQRRRNLVK